MDNLSEAIQFCLTPQAAAAAAEISHRMKRENGVVNAVRSFHANLPLENLQCNILRNQPAVWLFKRGAKQIRLSKAAAGVLFQHLKVDHKTLAMYVASVKHGALLTAAETRPILSGLSTGDGIP